LKKNETALEAHAWLRCGNVVITGADEMDEFEEVARYAKLNQKDKRIL
jgi:hypothetical protein